jgi:hypothetical protein
MVFLVCTNLRVKTALRNTPKGGYSIVMLASKKHKKSFPKGGFSFCGAEGRKVESDLKVSD